MTKHYQDTWVQKLHKALTKQDLTDNAIRSYLHDLNLFKSWLHDFYQEEIELIDTTGNDNRAFREYLAKIKRHILHEWVGHAKIVDSKGHKYREVPLNATARRALAA